jgi:hypothetical protein
MKTKKVVKLKNKARCTGYVIKYAKSGQPIRARMTSKYGPVDITYNEMEQIVQDWNNPPEEQMVMDIRHKG